MMLAWSSGLKSGAATAKDAVENLLPMKGATVKMTTKAANDTYPMEYAVMQREEGKY